MYSSKELRRFTKLEPWIASLAKKAFFQPQPDYPAFLSYLFSFCDYDCNPCFVYKTDEGQSLYNEQALKYLYENNLLDSLFEKENPGYRSPFEDFLFCLDENNVPTNKRAVTANHCERFFKDCGAFTETLFFKAYKGRLYMTERIGSEKTLYDEKEHVSKSLWTPDFSKVLMITDEENDFYVYQDASCADLRADFFEGAFPKRIEDEPLFVFNKKLYIRDVNKSDFYMMNGNSFLKTSNPFINSQNNSFIILILVIFLIIFFVISLLLFLRLRKINSSRFIFEVDQKVRSEISSNIHDSVVQDFRAIRLDVERLKVYEDSSDLQKNTVSNITECIKKMRDICYSLNPAEIASAELDGSNVNLLSVIQTLCTQFSERTKIPFMIDCEENLSSVIVQKEKALYASRIALEILSNIEKHSYATSFKLIVRQKFYSHEEKTATFIFIDDGKGCNLVSKDFASIKNHFGMRNMKQYAKLCGGKIEFLSDLNEGMQVRFSIKVLSEA